MLKIHFLIRLLVSGLMMTGCSIDIDQPGRTTSSPPIENTPATSSTELFSLTQIPVTWAHLNLTGELIFITTTREDNDFMSHIKMLNLGSGAIQTILSLPQVWIYYATVSPDTRNIVMSYALPAQSNSSTPRILHIMPLDGAVEPQPLFPPPTLDDRYIQAEWSPDGEHLYYVHYDNNIRLPGQLDPVYEIVRMKYPDGQPEKIAENAFWPRISQDSKKIVYISINPESGRNELYTANADGSSAEQITFSGSFLPDIIDAPIFSPDGQSILFSVPSPVQAYQPDWFEKLLGIQVAQAHDVPSDWWSVPVTGGVPTQLTNIQTINLFASISPDRRRIASVSGEGLLVMGLDGSNLTRLISGPEIHGTVTWIP